VASLADTLGERELVNRLLEQKFTEILPNILSYRHQWRMIQTGPLRIPGQVDRMFHP